VVMSEPTNSHVVESGGSTPPLTKLAIGHDPESIPPIFQRHQTSQDSSSCYSHIPFSVIQVIVFQDFSPPFLHPNHMRTPPQLPRVHHPQGVSTLLGLMIRLVCLRKCGRFHEPEPKQRDQPEPCARAVRYSVGRAVCTHRQ
jgi:hypothetical protein